MSNPFLKALDNIKSQLAAQGSIVEEQMSLAVESFLQEDSEQAQAVINRDKTIDDLRIKLEEQILTALVLYHPVAKELRLLIAALKATNTLERIGDGACNIAQRAIDLGSCKSAFSAVDIQAMSGRATEMLTSAIGAFIDNNAEMARDVIKMDMMINEANRANFDLVATAITDSPSEVRPCLSQLSISRYLEHMADLAKTIAEDTIFLAEGKVVEHDSTATMF